MECLHLPVRACGNVLLLVALVWLALPSTASSAGVLLLEFWCQASPQKATPRQVHALLRIVQQNHFISARALTAQMKNLYGMRVGRKSINSRLLSCGYHTYIDPQGSPCWLPTTAVSAWSGHRGGRTRQWPIGTMPSSVTGPDSNFTR